MRRGRNPAVERGNGYAEVLGYVSGRDSAGKQLLGRLDLAVSRLWLTTTLATKLTMDYSPTHPPASMGANPLRTVFSTMFRAIMKCRR